MKNNTEKTKQCICPYCDQPVALKAPYCTPCDVEHTYCSTCQKQVAKAANVCPDCGKSLK